MNEKEYFGVTCWVGSGFMSMGEHGVLWNNGINCLFDTRKNARKAINKTKKYAKKMNYDWNLHECYIQKVHST